MGGVGAGDDDCGVWFAVVDFGTTGEGSERTDFVEEAAVTDEEGLGVWGPFAFG